MLAMISLTQGERRAMGQMDPQLASLVNALNKVVVELGTVTTEMEAGAGQVRGTPAPIVDHPAVRRAQMIFDERRARERSMSDLAFLFGEPGWDMLLFLYLATKRGNEVSVSTVAYASAVPATTALRCLRDMEKAGTVRRWPDSLDGRRTLVELTTTGVAAMERYLTQARSDVSSRAWA
jgi:DNA-binding MarR family transcriptional regulator